MEEYVCMEDFDYDSQCYVILAIGKDEDTVIKAGLEVIGEGYSSKYDYRTRTIMMPKFTG